ncbi:MAG: hypothetical protein GY785_13360 [Gammaproteobacteria bacterium]|nr:hypothetical protein [Gammaproteobacteria bacterium]
MPKSRITEFARASRDVRRVQQAYGGYRRQAEVPRPTRSRLKTRMCHPAYPVHEHSGIIFARMGPPEEMIEFVIMDSYLQADTQLVPFSLYFPCNWVQLLDNTQDPTHSCFLHTRVSGAQFAESWGELPELEYLETPIGMINVNLEHDQARAFFANELAHFIEPYR